MKLRDLLFIGASSLVLFACGNEEAPEKVSTMAESEIEEVAAEGNEVESSGEALTLETFGEALEEAGFDYEEEEKMAAFIQATSGQGYNIDGEVVELYKYVEGSDIFEKIKEQGFVEIEGVIAVEVEINGEYVLMADGHPNADEIIEIFYSLDGSK